MFGQSKPFSFGGGTGSTFGNQATPFGSTTTSTFGSGFGATQNQPNTNMFGTAAQPTGSSLFGGTSAFGSSTGTAQSSGFTFGQPAASSNAGLFGGNQQASGGLFATPATKPSTFGGFGQTTGTSTSLFGAGNTSAGKSLFATSASTPSLFGGSSAFGGASAPSSGTTVKFNPPTGSDTMLKNGISTSISTKHQCCTAMKEYESKSLEELRMEDYLANRKGPSAVGTTSLFGQQQQQQTATNTGTFGNAFGTTATSKPAFGFGFTAAPSSTTTSLFGANQQQKGGLFGTATTTTTASTGFGGFGGGTTSLFGGQTNKPAFGSGFGTTAATTAASTGFGGFGGFGSTTNTGTSLFGNKPAFGSTTTTASTGTSGFSFGQPTAGTSLFGNTTAQKPAFGGFGTQANTGFNTGGTSLFQNKTPGFGATTGFGNTTGFGTTANTGTGLFGANTQTNQLGFTGGGLGGLQSGNQQTAMTGGNMATQQIQIQQQLVALANSPYGDSPLFRNLTLDASQREDLKPTNPAAQKAILSQASQYKVGGGIKTTPKIKPKPLYSLLADGKSQLFDGLDDDSSFGGNDTFVPRRSVKKLVIKKSSPKNNSLSSLVPQRADDDLVAPTSSYPATNSATPNRPVPEFEQSDTPDVILGSKSLGRVISPEARSNLDDTITALNGQNARNQEVPDIHQEELIHDNISDEGAVASPHPAGIVLTRPGYYTVPSMEELANVVDGNGDCYVENFTIGREGYGSVFFPGVTNVANMNLDEIVHFRRKEIIIYPDDSNKPEENHGLNKKAEVTLDCVWPTDKSTRSPIKSPDRLHVMNYHDKIEQSTLRIGAKFVDYRPETGSWVFEVKHFSKYGLVDSDDEDDASQSDIKKLKLQQQQQLSVQKQKIQLTNGKQPPTAQQLQTNQVVPPVQMVTMGDDDDSDMEDIEQEQQPIVMTDVSGEQSADVEHDVQTIPASHRIAQSMQVDARSVQMMKASFFGSDEEGEMEYAGLGGVRINTQQPRLPRTPITPRSPAIPQEKSALNQSLLGSLLKPQYASPHSVQDKPIKSYLAATETRSHAASTTRTMRPPAVVEHPIIPSGMARPDRPKKIVGSRTQPPVEEFSKSVMYDKQDMIMDAGLFMGRSFRVGWGPNWTLAHSGVPVNPQKQDTRAESHFSILPGRSRPVRGRTSPFSVVLEKVHASSPDGLTEVEKAMYVDRLQIQLDSSQTTVQDGCPVFAASPGVAALHKYAENSEKCLESPDEIVKQTQLVWSLCVALWGQLPNHEDDKYGEESYRYHMARREAVSKWLEKSFHDDIKQEIQTALMKRDGNISAVFSLLSGRQVAESCDQALKVGDCRLALLLAQAVGSNVPRQMLKKQLAEWCEHKVDKYITAERLKVYCLLAGVLTWQASTKFINTCTDLEWKRAFALHLWFHCPANAVVADALHAYDSAFKSGGDQQSYARGPHPPYMAEGSEMFAKDEDPDHVTNDMCYHLLTLFCKRSHRLDRVLAPTTSTPNQLDYSLSWHLMQVLQALNYSHLSEYHSDSIHCNYAAQLESHGLWQWAAFILLHIQDQKRREMCVRRLLASHVSLSTTEESSDVERFLQEQLHIPSQWLHSAKAIRARCEGMKKEEAWHLLKAGQWNKSHQIVLRHIAPDCIINENYEYLKQFLSEMSKPSHCATVTDWNVGGALYLDYINIIEQLDALKRNRDAYKIEKLEPEVVSLCSRVRSLHCHDAKTKLCQSEMAKKTANLMHTLSMLQSQDSDCNVSARLLGSHISQLPMPEDYALQELRMLSRSYMLEILCESK